MVALIVGYAGMFIAITVLTAAYADARAKDLAKARKLAALTEQERAESQIDENLGFGRAIIAADGTIIKWSGALPKWTRWYDAVGKPLVTIIPEAMREAHVAAFNAALVAASKNSKYETQVVSCRLPRIDDMSKSTRVTIVTSILQPEVEGQEPIVVAHVYRASNLRVLDIAPKE